MGQEFDCSFSLLYGALIHLFAVVPVWSSADYTSILTPVWGPDFGLILVPVWDPDLNC